jgi:hypothetical protein
MQLGAAARPLEILVSAPWAASLATPVAGLAMATLGATGATEDPGDDVDVLLVPLPTR